MTSSYFVQWIEMDTWQWKQNKMKRKKKWQWVNCRNGPKLEEQDKSDVWGDRNERWKQSCPIQTQTREKYPAVSLESRSSEIYSHDILPQCRHCVRKFPAVAETEADPGMPMVKRQLPHSASLQLTKTMTSRLWRRFLDANLSLGDAQKQSEIKDKNS